MSTSGDTTPLLGTPTTTPSNHDSINGKPSTSTSTSSPRQRRILLRQGQATLFSCIANLANTIIGTGALAMAHAFSGEGLIPGIFMVLFCASTAYLGLYFLTRSARLSPGHRQASFSSLSKMTVPGLARLFDFAVALKCFGVSISYLIVIGGLMPKVMKSFNPTLTLDSILLDRRLWILLSMTLLCPLAFLRRLDSLKVTSYIALCAIAYLVFIVLYYSITGFDTTPSRGEVELFRFGPSFVQSLPVQIFAFTCAQNIFAVFNELKSNTQSRLNLVIGTSIGSAAIIYEVLGILGYLAFGSTVGGNLIEMYPHSTAVSICQLGITVLVLFSYPLQLHPARASLDKFLFPTPSSTSTTPSSFTTTRMLQESDDDEEDSGRLGGGVEGRYRDEVDEVEEGGERFDREEDDDESTISPTPNSTSSSSTSSSPHKPNSTSSSPLIINSTTTTNTTATTVGGEEEIPLTRFIIESSLILFSTFCIAMFVSSLETVLGFVGATGSTTISFILPSIFFLSLFKDSPSPKDRKLRWLAMGLLAWGVIVMVLSLSMNIYHLVQKPESSSLHTLGYLGGKSTGVLAPTTELPIDG